jgi:hypothetical protein
LQNKKSEGRTISSGCRCPHGLTPILKDTLGKRRETGELNRINTTVSFSSSVQFLLPSAFGKQET